MLTLLSIAPTKFPLDGGVEFTITANPATFVLGTAYAIYVGPNGGAADAQCYSGVTGQGFNCYPLSATQIKAVSPMLRRHATLIVTVAGGGDSGQLISGQAIEYSFADQLFWLRKHWPRSYSAGPRGLDREPRQDL